MPTERDITEKLKGMKLVPAGSPVVLGIGDDCAIYRPRGSADDLLFTTDMLIEGVHFEAANHKARDVGWKALARGLSDIAAMGGAPRFCLVSLCVPGWADRKWIDGFFEPIVKGPAPLVGGDLSHGATLACDVVVCGAVQRNSALLRSGARPGHEIWVSGKLGGSALGLQTKKGKAWRRHLHPEPRLALGAFLRENLRATAAMDISDGLSLDLERMCLASGAGAELGSVPAFPGATEDQALHGGEEYELLFTVRAGTRVPSEFEGVPLTRIGVITAGQPGRLQYRGERLEPLGYDHFRTSNPVPR